MITVQITPDTPSHMLRAIRAACNELLGEKLNACDPLEWVAAERTLKTLGYRYSGSPHWIKDEEPAVDTDQEQAEGREPSLSPLHAAPYGQDNAQIAQPQPFEETDSAGHAWSAELHASTKSKNADGTWKKRRGARDPRDVASDPAGILIHEAGAPLVAAPIAPPVPPTPPAPTAEPIMPKIFALITSQIVTINEAVEAAQAEGYADLGANGLGGAPREAQEAVLRKLEGE